jgi:hypothetical protein
LIGVTLVSPATAVRHQKPHAGPYVVLDRLTSPVQVVSWPYPTDGPDVRAISIYGTLRGCVPGALYLWSGSSSLGPQMPNFALGAGDGVECGDDGTLRIGVPIWEDPEVGNVLAAGMRGTASLSVWLRCWNDAGDWCEPAITGSARVQIPRR